MNNELNGNFDLIKKINLEKVYKLILLNQPISRARVAKLSKLNKATVSTYVDFLLKKGIIQELGITVTERGRPPTMISINGSSGILVGIESDILSSKILVTDLSGKELEIISLPETGPDPQAFMQLISTTIANLKKKYQSRKLGVVGMGIAITGFYNHQNGIVEYVANRKSWNGFPIYQEIKHLNLGVPFYIQSIANAGALGEIHFGKSNPSEHLAYIAGSWGLGIGIYMNGNLTSGRFGHSIICCNGKQCVCGNKGCLEAYASVRSLLENLYPKKTFNYMYFQDILNRLKNNDPPVVTAVHELAKYLAIGIVNIINAFKASQICIGGLTDLLINDDLLNEIKTIVNQMVPEHFRRNLNIYCSNLGDRCVVYGCIAMVRDHLIEIIIDTK